MARSTISTHVAAPPDWVFARWTNLERMGEWVGGVTGVSDVSGPVDHVGTTYVVHFGPVKRPPEVLISAISSRIFSRGSYEGSLRGELEKFAPLAESSPR